MSRRESCGMAARSTDSAGFRTHSEGLFSLARNPTQTRSCHRPARSRPAAEEGGETHRYRLDVSRHITNSILHNQPLTL
jgi:hypothetical protein